MKTRPLNESALLIAIFGVMAFMLFYTPFGFVVSAVLAIPHAIISYKHGLKTGLIALVAAGLLLFLLMDIFSVIAAISLFAATGVAMGYGARRWSGIKSVLLGALIASIGFGVQIYLFSIFMGYDFFAEFLRMYELGIEQAASIYGTMGVEMDSEAIMNILREFTTVLRPSLLILVGFAPAYVNYKLLNVIGKRIKVKVPDIPHILQWTFPKWMGVAFVLGNLMYRLPLDVAFIGAIGYNLFFIFSWVVLAQGFSLVILFISKYIKSRIFLTILVLVILINPFLAYAIRMVGLFDMLFDYRAAITERRK